MTSEKQGSSVNTDKIIYYKLPIQRYKITH